MNTAATLAGSRLKNAKALMMRQLLSMTAAPTARRRATFSVLFRHQPLSLKAVAFTLPIRATATATAKTASRTPKPKAHLRLAARPKLKLNRRKKRQLRPRPIRLCGQSWKRSHFCLPRRPWKFSSNFLATKKPKRLGFFVAKFLSGLEVSLRVTQAKKFCSNAIELSLQP